MPRAAGIFLTAVLVGAGVVLGLAAIHRDRAPAQGEVAALQLVPGVFVTAQVVPAQLAALQRRGFAAVVDLRPDGEVADQPSSRAMARTAAELGMDFHYTPVPHGEIPADAVADLRRVLAADPRPVLLYCHSGRRAARTWALAEASRKGGLDAAAIAAAVRAVGQPVDDLSIQLASRVAARGGTRPPVGP